MKVLFNDPILEQFVNSDFNKKVEIIQSHGINSKNDRWAGKTLLHIAAIYGDLDSIQFLIDNGADVNARDKNGFSPLFDSMSLNE